MHRLTAVHFDVGDDVFDRADLPTMLFGHPSKGNETPPDVNQR
jgi:hypothetical protein